MEQPQQIEVTESFVNKTDLQHRHGSNSFEEQTSIELIDLCDSDDSSAQNDEIQLVTSMPTQQHRVAKKRRFACEQPQQQSQITMQNGITGITQSTVKVGRLNHGVVAKKQTSPTGFESDDEQQRIESTTNFDNNESVIPVKTSNNISAAMVTPKEEPNDITIEEVPLSISQYLNKMLSKEDVEIDRDNEMNENEDNTQIDEFHCIEIDDGQDNEIRELNEMESKKNDKKKLSYGIKTISLRCDIDGCEYMADKKRIICHERETHGVCYYKCCICDPIISFNTRKFLSDHIKLKHSRETDFRCDHCSRKFSKYSTYKDHVYRNHKTGLFRCSAPDCAFEHTIRKQVYDHIHREHKRYLCTFAGCGQSFYFKRRLRWHELIHLQVQPYSCAFSDHCNFASNLRGAVMQHIRMVHFRLPQTEKKQRELNIIDQRDPNVYLRVDEDLIRTTMDSASDPN